MKIIRRLFTSSFVAFIILTNVFSYNMYNKFNSYNYDSMYIFNELRNIIAIDFDKELISVFNTRKTLEAQYIMDINSSEEINVRYYNSSNYIFIHIYNDTFECLYSIEINDEFSFNKIYHSNVLLNDRPQYLNFNDYIFFYENNSKLSSIRIKNNREYLTNYDIAFTTEIEDLDKYGYKFKIGEENYCIDNSKFEGRCSESKYNDVNYVGEYMLNEDDKISVYNKYSKEYVETVFNSFEYKDNVSLFIDKSNRLFFLYGEKNKDLQMIPYVMMLNPTEEYKVSLEALNTSFTRSKIIVPSTIYFSDIYICATGTSAASGLIKAGCFYPNTSEAVYEVNNKQLNFYNGYSVDDYIYKSFSRFMTFTVIYNLLLILVYVLIRKYLLKNISISSKSK